MLSLAVTLLTIAVVLGTGLALWHLRATDDAGRPPMAVGVVHGCLGAAGLAVLLVVLQGPPRGVSAGAGAFGPTAAIMFSAALAFGLVMWSRRRNTPVVLMAIHSGIAITAYVLFVAWSSLS
ncbi:hypothetical protein [Rhodopila globiformis]|uniref:Integral membrane protein n=1 Tax=Rhodopila globiformis TaxID=1071 RepID=A0A2S6NLX2_RHOGL|nr:hypothetical protein [Rhodopila globiformis]PPQ36572.1 hypothetical protein CCS01_04875 [Rhodopila globiformis]